MCVCYMPIDDVVQADVYQLDLWAGKHQLWGGSFQPSKHGKGGMVERAQGRGGFRSPAGLRGRGGPAPVGSEEQAVFCVFADMMRCFFLLSRPQSSYL